MEQQRKHMGRSDPVARREGEGVWLRHRQSVQKKSLSLYIHIPFCKTICLYCNFLTFAHKNKFIPEYVETLRREITAKSRTCKNFKVETIYFGGGTPSLIDAEYVSEILATIRSCFKTTKKLEISIECNPESIDSVKLQKYFEAGVTRVSLGIQNFDKKILFRIARPHDDKTIFKALEAIQQSPIKNYGADFIIGLPHQTLEHFQNQLKTILQQNIPHLSFYFLSYDTKKIDLFKSDCPNDEAQIAMYEHLTKKLKKAGYDHYEVSNYAKPGYKCLHNLRYWNQKEYLGLGLGAHSYIDQKCIENTTNFDEYLKNPMAVSEEIPIDRELHELEYIMLHLRTRAGIDLKEFERKFSNQKTDAVVNKKAELMKKAGPYLETNKLTLKNGRLQPTDEGFLLIDKITNDLL